MKLLAFVTALASAQVSFFTGNLNNITLANFNVAYKGGSITAHLAQRLREYGLPRAFTDELDDVEDSAWAAVVAGVSEILFVKLGLTETNHIKG